MHCIKGYIADDLQWPLTP